MQVQASLLPRGRGAIDADDRHQVQRFPRQGGEAGVQPRQGPRQRVLDVHDAQRQRRRLARARRRHGAAISAARGGAGHCHGCAARLWGCLRSYGGAGMASLDTFLHNDDMLTAAAAVQHRIAGLGSSIMLLHSHSGVNKVQDTNDCTCKIATALESGSENSSAQNAQAIAQSDIVNARTKVGMKHQRLLHCYQHIHKQLAAR